MFLLQVLICTLALFLIVPFLLVSGVGIALTLLVTIIPMIPYILTATVLYGAYRVFTRKQKESPRTYTNGRPPSIRTIKYNGKEYPIGVLVWTIGLAILITPIILIALLLVLPWQYAAMIVGLAIITGKVKKRA